jgi:hypothetical protein
MMFEMTLVVELGIIWSTFEEGYIFVIVVVFQFSCTKIEQAEICQFSYQPKTTQLQEQKKILLNFIQYALMKSSHICTPPITP